MSWTIHGDAKIMFKHAGFSNKIIARLMFNTSFIQRGNYIKAGKMELSPEDIRKDNGKIIPNDFIVYIFFEDFCSTCNPFLTEIEDLCDMCKAEIGEQTLQEWLQVKQIFAEHDFPTDEKARQLLPNLSPKILDEVAERQLKFNPNYYRIWTPEELDKDEQEEIDDKDYDSENNQDSDEEKKVENKDVIQDRKSLNARGSNERSRGS